MHYNMLGQPAMWERFFDACHAENVGIEWDASHLICQFIDPVTNIHKFGSRIFHVHAKDAYINRRLLEVYGICHPGVAEHRMDVTDFRTERSNLEDVFLKVTGHSIRN